MQAGLPVTHIYYATPVQSALKLCHRNRRRLGCRLFSVLAATSSGQIITCNPLQSRCDTAIQRSPLRTQRF